MLSVDVRSSYPKNELQYLIPKYKGVYCLLEVGSNPVKIVAFQLLAEDYLLNGGKREAALTDADFTVVPEDTILTPLSPDMMSLVSGGVKKEDTSSRAAVCRELREEIGHTISPQDLLSDSRLPITLTLQQRPPERLVVIEGEGYLHRPQPRVLEDMKLAAARRGQRITVATPNELLHSSKYTLRPFFKSVLLHMVAHYES